ncbi:MAG: histidine phosphatase family protein [Candidatus Omnitrophica bacterium]|nr:histidine phosphatase family protein [Candidatus Omnitrophota bacterium]
MTRSCYLIRHAQTTWNSENRIQGHADLPLSDAGHQQAERVGAYFADRSITALYTSHLARSLQTALAISQTTGVSPTVEPALSEIHFGAWEGLTAEQVNAAYDGAYHRWRTNPSEVTIPGAELLESFRARVRMAVGRILAAHDEGGVVIVSHGGVIASLFADWLLADYDALLQRLVVANAGISAVDCRTDPPSILWVNVTSHLTGNGYPAA